MKRKKAFITFYANALHFRKNGYRTLKLNDLGNRQIYPMLFKNIDWIRQVYIYLYSQIQPITTMGSCGNKWQQLLIDDSGKILSRYLNKRTKVSRKCVKNAFSEFFEDSSKKVKIIVVVRSLVRQTLYPF